MKAEIIVHLTRDPKKQPRMMDAVKGVIELFHHRPVMEAEIDTSTGQEVISMRFKLGPNWETWRGTAAELKLALLGPIHVQISQGKVFSLDPRVEITDHDQKKLDADQKAEDEADKKHQGQSKE